MCCGAGQGVAWALLFAFRYCIAGSEEKVGNDIMFAFGAWSHSVASLRCGVMCFG
jgi:hypothetical protein